MGLNLIIPLSDTDVKMTRRVRGGGRALTYYLGIGDDPEESISGIHNNLCPDGQKLSRTIDRHMMPRSNCSPSRHGDNYTIHKVCRVKTGVSGPLDPRCVRNKEYERLCRNMNNENKKQGRKCHNSWADSLL